MKMGRTALSFCCNLALTAVLAAGSAFGAEGVLRMTFTLTSPVFQAGGEIPARYTCEGNDTSPPLAWSAPPVGTRSLALIVDDPDAPDPKAPKTTWVHWVVYNLPPGAGSLAADAARAGTPAGARQGLNDWKRPATVGVRQSGDIVTSTNSMPWTTSCPTYSNRPKPSWKPRCAATSSPPRS